MIGCFGDYIFETTDKRILTFSGLKRNAKALISEHTKILGKAQVEFNGSEADTISFTINLNGLLGVSPRAEMDKWIKLVREGYVGTLVIGNKALGVNKWIITSVAQSWDTILNAGELLKGKIEVELKEYIEEYNYSFESIPRQDITLIKDDEEIYNAKGIVVSKVLNVRENAGVNYPVVEQYTGNTEINIFAQKNGWYKIGNNKYVCGQYIKILEG